MRRLALVMGLGLAVAGALPGATALAGGRSPMGGTRAAFRSPADFHSRQGLTGGYRSPGNFFARDSVLGREAPQRFFSGGAVTWAPIPAWPSGIYASPDGSAGPEITVAPVTQVYSTVYVAPPAAPASAVAAVPPAPAAPPAPTVIEYPTGRYELRGDGVTTAYAWVWIPNPPPAPPPAARGPAPPTPEESPPTRVYRWTDESGTTFLTNRREAVPERQRSLLDDATAPALAAPTDEASSSRLAVQPPAPARPGS